VYPQEYISYLVHFHGDRDYFECHEILEDYWKHLDPGNKDSIWVGLIQLAVSCYHHRRGNFKGAKKTLEKASTILCIQNDSVSKLGLNQQLLIQLVREQISTIEKENPYKSFYLPIDDPLLEEDCIKTSKEQGFRWGIGSDMSNVNLVHRHKLRDRSSIILERNLALKDRKGNES
jgi:hypothetical protein